MVKKILTPVMVLAVFTAAQGQRSVSSASQSHNTSTHVSRTSSSGFSSQHTSSYSSSARYSSSGSGNHSTGGYRSTVTYGSQGNNERYQATGRYRSDASMLPVFGGGASVTTGREASAAVHNGYLVMDDKYALAPLPKTVPTSNTNTQRGLDDLYVGAGGTGGGLQGNPFHTPGFASSCGDGDDSHDYQIQFMNFVQGRSLYGLPWNSWVGRRYIYRNYWRSNFRFICQESLRSDLARAKTPAQLVEVMRSYHRCLRTVDGDEYYNYFYPSSGGWRW